MTATTFEHHIANFAEDSLLGMRGRDATPTERRSWDSPGDLARELDPGTIQTPALELIDQALVDVDAGRCDRLIISMPPQEGKSTRVTKVGPTWMLTRNPRRRIVVVSYGQDLANEFGRDIRGFITSNQGEDDTLDVGLRIAKDNGSVSSWKLEGYRGGVRSVGVGGGIVGRPADMMFIDDPITNREQAESETYRQRAKNFWTGTASTRLAPGAPVVLILTRWHEDDLAGWLQTRPDGHRWRVINIPAQADHDPNKGETDPLGRAPGEYMISARVDENTGQPRTTSDWEQVKVQAGSRDWQSQYQGNPSPPEGGILKRSWWRSYEMPLWLEVDGRCRVTSDDVELIASWDLAFKATTTSDYVVGQVWMRRGADAYLLDQIRGRMDFVETCAAVKRLAEKWPQATLKLVEDKANGPAVIATLQHTVPGIVPEEPDGSKEARAYAVSPVIEAGNVWLPSPNLMADEDRRPYAWVEDFIEETAGFPNAKHDDVVDAMSQALKRLFLQPFAGGDDWEPEEYDVLDTRGFYASPV
jgi:predicted phage terminase large subunit-like protein